MKKRRNDLLIDLFLLLVVCALYAATSEQALGRQLARMTMSPVYRGGGESVGLVVKLDYDAAALGVILETLDASDTRVTFAIGADWAKAHPDGLSALAKTHELAVSGAAMSEALEALTAILESGGEARYYYGAPDKNGSRIAKKLELTHISCTADVLCAQGTPEDIAARALNAAAKGSILLTQPTGAFAKALPGLLAQLQTKGLRVASVSDAIKAK